MTEWHEWRPAPDPYTVGLEEEVMLLEPHHWSLAPASVEVIEGLPDPLTAHVGSETHASALELATGVHRRVGEAAEELAVLRHSLTGVLEELGLAAAVAGTHPFAVWQDMLVTERERHQLVSGSMRALARREPTFALHVHVGLGDPETAIAAANRMRVHLPMLLALSANSPFWQGRDTGLASARTPLFQAFPRVGIPRAFADYAEYVEAVDLLIRCEAFSEPTFLWWDVRPQPRFGTIEIRIMDAQSTMTATRALVAFTQCLVALEATEGFASADAVGAPEALDENRFLAARDGIDARFIDPGLGLSRPLRVVVDELLAACLPHAEALGCADELALVPVLFEDASAARQRRLAEHPRGLPALVGVLADDFAGAPTRTAAR